MKLKAIHQILALVFSIFICSSASAIYYEQYQDEINGHRIGVARQGNALAFLPIWVGFFGEDCRFYEVVKPQAYHEPVAQPLCGFGNAYLYVSQGSLPFALYYCIYTDKIVIDSQFLKVPHPASLDEEANHCVSFDR